MTGNKMDAKMDGVKCNTAESPNAYGELHKMISKAKQTGGSGSAHKTSTLDSTFKTVGRKK